VRWLIDEMLPPAAAAELNRLGHDAAHVNELGLAGQPDPVVFDVAVAQARTVVTENIADYAALVEARVRHDEPCVPVVFVHKRDLPRRGALAAHLAARLGRWADANPEPFVGPHWP
jgi:predicted nuclease of predicted toxin-antitoxin system